MQLSKRDREGAQDYVALTGSWYIHSAFIQKRIFWAEGVSSECSIFGSTTEQVLFRGLIAGQSSSLGGSQEDIHRAPTMEMRRTRPVPESSTLSSLPRSSQGSKELSHCLSPPPGGVAKSLLMLQKVIRVQEWTLWQLNFEM